MRTRRICSMLAVGALALGAAGCGGSKADTAANPASSGKATGSSSLTRTEYAKQANAICKKAAATSPAFPGTQSGSGYKTTAAAVVPYLQKVHTINETALVSLRGLHAPKSQGAAAARLVSAQQARVRDLSRALQAARKADGKAFTTAFQRDQKTDAPRYFQAAVQLGLKTCANPAG